MSWYLLWLLLCMALMANDVEHLLICFLGHLDILLCQCLFKSFVHLKNWVFIYFKLICRTYLHFLVCVLCYIYNLRDIHIHIKWHLLM